MNAYVFVNDCDTYETTRFANIESAAEWFKGIAADPRGYSPVAAVQFAQNKGELYAAEHSAHWLVYADGVVTVATSDPRVTERHPNSDSLED